MLKKSQRKEIYMCDSAFISFSDLPARDFVNSGLSLPLMLNKLDCDAKSIGIVLFQHAFQHFDSPRWFLSMRNSHLASVI